MATPVLTMDVPRLRRRLTSKRRRLAECREAVGNIVDLDHGSLEILALRDSEILTAIAKSEVELSQAHEVIAPCTTQGALEPSPLRAEITRLPDA
jgi:hypothetical protein